jgi:Skp family chaperone for outer membrane proteins
MVPLRRLGLALALAAGLAGPVAGQGLSLGESDAPILTVDQDRLYLGSAWGRRVAAETEAEVQALSAENRALEAQLAAEEQALTERRGSLTPEEFRAEADAFDARAVQVRRDQDAKERDLLRNRDAERQRFFGAALPVMGQAMQDRGALVILDRRSVFLALEVLDVTDDFIARIDAAIGDGTEPPAAP